MTLLWEALPLATLTGTSLYGLVKWRDAQREANWLRRRLRRTSSASNDFADLYGAAQRRLDAIRLQRSETTRRGNLTRSANRKAAEAAKRAETTYRLEVGR